MSGFVTFIAGYLLAAAFVMWKLITEAHLHTPLGLALLAWFCVMLGAAAWVRGRWKGTV